MSHYDKIASSTPINAAAARVTYGGENFDDTHLVRSSKSLQFSTCPKLADLRELAKNPSFTDLTGVRYGRLRVVGALEKDGVSSSDKARWVVRCDCGDYTTQKTKTVKRASPAAMCLRCVYLRSLKHHDRIAKELRK